MAIPVSYEQVTYNGPDGAQVGQSTSEFIGFFGGTPTSQPGTISATGTSLSVAFGTVSGVFGFSTLTAASNFATTLNAVYAALVKLGITGV